MLIIGSWTLIGLVVGAMLGGALGDMAANHPGDIGRILGGVIVGGLLGGTCGGVLGKMVTTRLAGNLRRQGQVFAGTCIAAGLVLGGIVIFETERERRDQEARLPDPLVVQYEIRLPPGMTVNPEHVMLEMRTSVGVEPPYPYQQRPPVMQEDGRAVIRSGFRFFKAATKRTVALTPALGQPAYLFNLRLPERPTPDGPRTDWQRVDQVDEGGWFKAPRPARPDEQLEIRYAVVRS